jgi:hypothetical protein
LRESSVLSAILVMTSLFDGGFAAFAIAIALLL